jgi:hypothetical protein
MVMLLYAASRLQQNTDASDTRLRSLILEACLVHFRALLGFFYGKRDVLDDVLVEDYILPGPFTATRPEWLDVARRRCNKLLAHLTYTRTKYADDNEMIWGALPGWILYLKAEWGAFLDSLPPGKKTWFADDKSAGEC